MKALITGITGLLGSELARYLLDKGVQVRGLIRVGADTSLLSDCLSRIECVEGDLLDVCSIDTAMKGIDWVIHAAAIVSFVPKDRLSMYQTNVEGTANMINQALRNGKIKKFCHVSSIAALGRPEAVFKETCVPWHIDESNRWEESEYNNHYAKSKFLAELEVWRGGSEGLPMVILNPTTILGEGDWNKTSTQLFKYVYSEHTLYASGYINYVDVKDVAHAAFELCNSPIVQERFVITAGKISYLELFKKIAKVLNKKPPHILVKPFWLSSLYRLEMLRSWFTRKAPLITKETARTSQLNICYSSTKIKSAIGFSPRSLDQTINRIGQAISEKYTHPI